MRVLAIMASGARGGGANHLVALLPELLRSGVDVQAAVGSDGPLARELAAVGVPVVILELMGARLDPFAPLRLAAAVRASHPDVVHYHGTRAAFFGALARPLLPRGQRTMYTVHGLAYAQGGPRRAVFRLAEKLACRGAGHVVSVALPDLEDLRARGFVRPEASSHVPNPVDAERFRPRDGAAVRAMLGLPTTAFVVGTVARLVPQKAVGDLVEAISLCRTPATLVVVGDGPERDELEALAARYRLQALFLGSRDDVADLLAAFDVFALSSRWEGEPIALLEAMAAGLACVATATPGTRALLDDVPGARLVPPAEPRALAAGLDAVAELSRADRSRIGAAARDRVRARTPRRLADELERLYERLLAEPVVAIGGDGRV